MKKKRDFSECQLVTTFLNIKFIIPCVIKATEVVPYGTLIDFGEYEDLDVVNLEATISKEPVEDGCPVPASSTTVENAEDKETTEPVEEKQMSSHSDYGQ